MTALLALPAMPQDFLAGSGPGRLIRVDQRLGQRLPLELRFRDENGRAVRLADYFGSKPVVITPVYYGCPMLCTYVLEGLVSSLRELRFDVGKEFEVVTVSFDARETPRQAAEKKDIYVRHYGRAGAAAGWHFLTGEQQSITALMEAIGFRYRWDPKEQQWAHGTTIVVATPDGRIARYFFGIQYPPRDLRLGLVEASGGRIGSLSDQFLLLCYHYDSSTGKYTAVAMNAVRIGGGATVAALATFLIVMLRKERHEKNESRSQKPEEH